MSSPPGKPPAEHRLTPIHRQLTTANDQQPHLLMQVEYLRQKKTGIFPLLRV